MENIFEHPPPSTPAPILAVDFPSPDTITVWVEGDEDVGGWWGNGWRGGKYSSLQTSKQRRPEESVNLYEWSEIKIMPAGDITTNQPSPKSEKK